MSKSITYIIKLSTQSAEQNPPISLTNLSSGHSQAFSNLDNAIQYLDATHQRPVGFGQNQNDRYATTKQQKS